MDWNNHRTDNAAVMCRIQMRPTHNGQPIKPEAQALEGKSFLLVATFCMDDLDRYPGEWALRPKSGTPRLHEHIHWIASGDVQPIEAHASTPPAESSVAAGSNERGV